MIGAEAGHACTAEAKAVRTRKADETNGRPDRDAFYLEIYFTQIYRVWRVRRVGLTTGLS